MLNPDTVSNRTTGLLIGLSYVPRLKPHKHYLLQVKCRTVVQHAVKRSHFNSHTTNTCCTTVTRNHTSVQSVAGRSKNSAHFTIINVFILEKNHSLVQHVVSNLSNKMSDRKIVKTKVVDLNKTFSTIYYMSNSDLRLLRSIEIFDRPPKAHLLTKR
jgi:hypothetical protein